jgi:predicted DNA-binding protein
MRSRRRRMSTTFPVRGLAPEVVDRLDAAAKAEGSSRNAYIVRILTEHARRVRPEVTEGGFRRAADLAADLGDEDVMSAAWR